MFFKKKHLAGVSEEDRQKSLERNFFENLEEQRKKDPLIGAKIGAKDIWNTIVNAIKEPGGRVNANIALLWASGMAGYACQASVWDKFIVHGGNDISSTFVIAGTKSGRNFFLGDKINKPLLENQYSIWSLAAGKYHSMEPDKKVPDIIAMVKKSTEKIGDEEYKVWGEVNPYELIDQYNIAWNGMKEKICRYCASSDEWPLLFGLALQEAIEFAAKVIPADKCLTMAMENALFTSKLDISSYM